MSHANADYLSRNLFVIYLHYDIAFAELAYAILCYIARLTTYHWRPFVSCFINISNCKYTEHAISLDLTPLTSFRIGEL